MTMTLLGYIPDGSQILYSLTFIQEPTPPPASGTSTSSTHALGVPRCDRAPENARLKIAEPAPMTLGEPELYQDLRIDR